MKYILTILISIFVVSAAWARCVDIYFECPKKYCILGTFLGDDGACHSCWTDEDIPVHCIGSDKVYQLCPNRFTELECNEVSKLTCFGWSKGKMGQFHSIAIYFNPFLKLFTMLKNELNSMVTIEGPYVNYSNHTCRYTNRAD